MKSVIQRPLRRARAKVVSSSDKDCIEVAILGLLGRSTKAIQAETGFSACQVTYRLGRFDIKRSDYRNGDSESFAIVHALSRSKIMQLFRSNA